MRTRTSLALLTALAGATVMAACSGSDYEIDLLVFGRALDGDVVALASDAIDNQCMPLLGSGEEGLTLAVTPPADWEPGRRVFLQQVTDAFVESSGANATNAPGNAGQWEIVAIESIDATLVATRAAPRYSYESGPSKAAQACLVREYGTLTLQTNLVAPAWSGSAGGVIVFFVRDRLVNDSGRRIDASGAGFRGGEESGDTVAGGSTAYDTSAVLGGFKGAGVDVRSQTRNGRGVYRNAGGGGNANRGAGGGGAGAGIGGKGGNGVTGTSGGLAGLALLSNDLEPSRLFFGGGGGGGHAASGSTAGRGGDGGGVIFGGARMVVGTAKLIARGKKGQTGVTGVGAGGGGGGGSGMVVFWVSEDSDGVVSCDVRGDVGGNELGGGGIGGGGGGGACWSSGTAEVDGGSNAAPGVIGDPGPIPLFWGADGE